MSDRLLKYFILKHITIKPEALQVYLIFAQVVAITMVTEAQVYMSVAGLVVSVDLVILSISCVPAVDNTTLSRGHRGRTVHQKILGVRSELKVKGTQNFKMLQNLILQVNC